MDTQPRVFISYARSDGEAFAGDLRARLSAELGVEALWRDRDRMEGGVGWWKQIADALEAVSFMVLVATPAAMASPVVRKEWRYARQQGVCVYPVQVPGLPIDFAALPRWMRDSHFYNLDKEWETFVNYLKNPCHAVKVPFMAPDLPAHFVERPAQLNELIARLLDADRQNPVAITTALKGAGGFGKTTLAIALCHDEDVQAAFDDGILWATLGEKPDVVGGLTKLYEALTGVNAAFVDAEQGANKLAEKLADKDCLIVIDDVWNGVHLQPFLRGGDRCARLITTRDVGIAVGAKAQMTDVDEMTAAESIDLLSAGVTGVERGRLARMTARLGEWALMLELANAMLRERMATANDTPEHAFAWLEKVLDKRGVRGVHRDNEEQRKQDAAGVLASSLELLTADQRDRLKQLAVFKDDADVPLSSVGALWRFDDEFDAEELVLLLARLTLIKFSSSTGTIRLHDVVREYLATQIDDLFALHRALIEAWGDPYALPDHYAWQNYAYHLRGAGQAEQLHALLLDYRWIAAKLNATEIATLLMDFNYALGDEEVSLLKSAIILSSHILNKDKRQLGGQLLGRLMSYRNSRPHIKRLLNQITTTADLPAFLPSTPFLFQADSDLIRTLSGHASSVTTVVYSGNGRKIISGSSDTTVKLWDADSGLVLATLEGHVNEVTGVAFSPDEQRIVSASRDQTLKVWDAKSGHELFTLKGHWKAVTATAFSPNGQRIVSASRDQTLKVWDAKSGYELFTLKGHQNDVTVATFSPDGHNIMSSSLDGTAKVWDSSTGRLILTLWGHSSGVTAATYSPDGQHIATASQDHTIRVWDVQSGQTILVLKGHEHQVTTVAYSPNGCHIISGSWDRKLKLWDTQNGRELFTLKGHTGPINAVAYSPNGEQVTSASHDRTLKTWHLLGRERKPSVHWHSDYVNAVLFAADGQRIVSASSDCTVKVWSTENSQELLELNKHTQAVNTASFSPDGLYIVSASQDKTARIWSVESGNELFVLNRHAGPVYSAAYSPDGMFIVSASYDRSIKIWGAKNGRELHTLNGHTGPVYSAAYSPDGTSIVSVAADNSIRVWEAKGGFERLILHGDGIIEVAYSPEGDRMVGVSWDGTAKIWNVKSGRKLLTLNGHMSGIRVARWSPNGRHIVSASLDQTIRIWDAVLGNQLAVFFSDAVIECVCFSPKGDLIAAGDRSGNIQLFQLVGLY